MSESKREGQGAYPTLAALIDEQDPGIVLLHDLIAQPGANECVILPRDDDVARRTLLDLGVTTRSLLGAMAFETGGMSISVGLLRLFGAGRSRSLSEVNLTVGITGGSDKLLVADDALGGMFALNGGAFGKEHLGEVFYLPYDTTCWSSLDVGYSEFVSWCLTGDLTMLYPADDEAVLAVHRIEPSFERTLSSFPFPWAWSGEGTHSLKAVDANEHVRLRIELLGYDVVDELE